MGRARDKADCVSSLCLGDFVNQIGANKGKLINNSPVPTTLNWNKIHITYVSLPRIANSTSGLFGWRRWMKCVKSCPLFVHDKLQSIIEVSLMVRLAGAEEPQGESSFWLTMGSTAYFCNR